LSESPDFWNDPQEAQALMQERGRLEQSMEQVEKLETGVSDAMEFVEMAEADDDAEVLEEAFSTLISLKKEAGKAELEALLSGEAARWANAHKMKVDVLEEQAADEAGIKSATILIKGPNAFGWLKTESGVHRLVRISPFDSNARRHTSFASVWVYPEIDDKIEIDINESDCRVDTYRASGAGGQHINKTDSAVRITHEPSGIVVQCQSDRSQHKNRAQAWDMLRSRLYEKELQEREEAAQAQSDSKSEIGWGSQIRSYVLQPYQMIKDLRTGVETSDVSGVLDGDIDKFLEASLAAQVGGEDES